jgi:predicted esterase
MAVRHPDEIACVFPIAGELPARLRPQGHARTAPVYALHGTDDRAIRVDAARATIAALTAAGGTAELHVVTGVGHTIAPVMRDEVRAQVRAVAADLERYARREPGSETRTLWAAPGTSSP